MDDVLSHPLLLLAVGAVLSGWLVPRVTRRWQDQRKAAEVKADLVERVVRAVTEIFTAVQLAEVGAKSQTQADFDMAYRKWQTDKAILTSLLRAYFRNGRVDRAWLRCRALSTAYYVQSGIHDEGRRREYLEQVAHGLSSEVPKDVSDFGGPSGDEPPPEPSPLLDVGHLRSELQRQLDETIEVILDCRVAV